MLSAGTKVKLIIAGANIVFFYWLFTSVTWAGIGFGFLGYILIAKIGGDIGAHRYFTHRSFTAKKWAHWLFLILSVPVSFGSAMSWAAAHRLHHDKEDEPEDPHSPNQIGCVKVWLLMLGDKWHANPMYIKDLLRDKWQLFFHKNYFRLYTVWVVTLGAISFYFGWQWFVYLWALPVTLEYHASSAVNVICHKWGYKRQIITTESPHLIRLRGKNGTRLIYGRTQLNTYLWRKNESFKLCKS